MASQLVVHTLCLNHVRNRCEYACYKARRRSLRLYPVHGAATGDVVGGPRASHVLGNSAWDCPNEARGNHRVVRQCMAALCNPVPKAFHEKRDTHMWLNGRTVKWRPARKPGKSNAPSIVPSGAWCAVSGGGACAVTACGDLRVARQCMAAPVLSILRACSDRCLTGGQVLSSVRRLSRRRPSTNQ